MTPPDACLLRIEATACPGTLPRLLNIIAKRDSIPLSLHATRRGDMLHIDLQLEPMPETVRGPLLGNMRQMIEVISVEIVPALWPGLVKNWVGRATPLSNCGNL